MGSMRRIGLWSMGGDLRSGSMGICRFGEYGMVRMDGYFCLLGVG